MAILQSIKEISVTHGRPHVLLPLIMVMLTVFVKDAFEEYSRFKKDKEANNRPVLVLEGGEFVTTTWERLMIGSVIKIKCEEFSPCDFVVLQSSDKKGKSLRIDQKSGW